MVIDRIEINPDDIHAALAYAADSVAHETILLQSS